MEKLPAYVESWIVKRTQERHYLCRLCGYADEDHGNEVEFHRHLSSGSHRIRIRKMEGLYCKVCQLQCKFPSTYSAHINSKAHIQKENPQPKQVVEYRCDTCVVTLQSHKDMVRHLATTKHAKLSQNVTE